MRRAFEVVLLLGVGLSSFRPAVASAELVSFDFEATTTTFTNPPQGIMVGDPLFGTYTFDIDTPESANSIPVESIAIYEDAVVCIEIDVGPLRLSAEGVEGQLVPNTINITDGSSIGSTDQYIIIESELDGDFDSFLLSLTGNMGQNGIQGTQLQDNPPLLSEFGNSTNLQFVIPTMPLSSAVHADLTLLVRAVALPSPEEVFECPEPGSDALVLACLGSLALLRRQER
jgi:hypothetical protein